VAIGFVAVFALATQANAIVTNYGNFLGPDVMYLNVQEDTMKMPGPTPAQLFGPPTLVGTVLDFDPMGFEAHADNGAVAMTNSLLQTTIMATDVPGDSIGNVFIDEMGGYGLMGNTLDNWVSVSIDVIGLKVLEVNGAAIMPFFVNPVIAYQNLGSALDTNAFGGMRLYPDGDGMWKASASFDVTAALAANNIPGVATKVELMVDNMLKAHSEVGGMAFIDKKDFQIKVVPVPEPSTILLGAFGFVGLAVTARKWRRARAA
jgi:hypothetical protein